MNLHKCVALNFPGTSTCSQEFVFLHVIDHSRKMFLGVYPNDAVLLGTSLPGAYKIDIGVLGLKINGKASRKDKARNKKLKRFMIIFVKKVSEMQRAIKQKTKIVQ